MSRLFFISTDGPMAVQMSFVCHTEQVVMIAESFLKKSVSSGAPLSIVVLLLEVINGRDESQLTTIINTNCIMITDPLLFTIKAVLFSFFTLPSSRKKIDIYQLKCVKL